MTSPRHSESPLVPDDLKWLKPWELLEHGQDHFESELHSELSSKHVLYKTKAVAIARRFDRDDFLFAIDLPRTPLAVVHLTFANRPEPDSKWPSTWLYSCWQDWIERCLVADHEEYGE